MYIYIVARVLNSDNKSDSYLLLDIDDNCKTLIVSKQQLINKMLTKKVKIHNAKLVNKHLAGTYYSLSILPCIKDSIIYNGTKHICLKNYDNKKFLFAYFNSDNTISLYNATYNNVIDMASSGVILNINETGEPLCEKIASISSSKDLDKDVLNLDSVWTIDDFKLYMNKHNYSYYLEQLREGNYCLGGLPKECTKVKIPSSVTTIIQLYKEPVRKIDSIIISGDTNRIKTLYDRIYDKSEEAITEVNQIYFQSKVTNTENTAFMEGLEYLNIHNLINMPNYRTVKSIFNHSVIDRVYIKNCFELQDTFNDCTINSRDVSVNVINLYESFCTLNSNNNIIIGKCKNILNSFKESNETSVNFLNACNINSIQRSFNNNNNIKEIDLSKCSELRKVSDAFKLCKELHSIILPDSLVELGVGFAYKTPLDIFKIPKNIKLCPSRMAVTKKIIYHSGITEINNYSFVNNAENVHVENYFEYPISRIAEDAFQKLNQSSYEISTTELNIPKDKCTFSKRAFRKCPFNSFDSREFLSLRNIPENCFEDSENLKWVILGDNIVEIEANAFKNTVNLEKIIIGSNITKMSLRAFSSMHSKFTVFFTVKGSYASKMLTKAGYTVNNFNSLDDAIQNALYSEKTSQIKRGKFMLVLNNTEYEQLLDEPYIKDVDYSYSLLMKLENNQKQHRLKLNTSKYTSTKLDEFEIFRHLLDKKELVTDDVIFDDNFISLSNLITKICNQNDKLYKKQFKSSDYFCDDIQYMYDEEYCTIFEAYISNHINISFSILGIIIGDNIVFLTNFDYAAFEDYCGKQTTLSLISGSRVINAYNLHGDSNVSIADELIPGDLITTNKISINNALIPNIFMNKIIGNLNNTLRYIGTSASKNMLGVSKRDSKFYKTLFFDTLSSKFIEANTKFEFDSKGMDDIAVNNIIEMYIINVYNFNDINKINKNYFDCFYNAINNNRDKVEIDYATTSDEEFKQLFDISNYDINDNKSLTEFADAMYKYNVNKKEDLTLSIAKNMLKLELFTGCDLTLDICRTKNVKSHIYTLKNSDSMLIEYKFEYNNYAIGIIDMNTPMNSKSVLYYSPVSIDKVILTLYYMGKVRAENKYTRLNRVSNETINTDAFAFIDTLVLDTLANNDIKFDIAIEYMTGYTYIICERWDMDFYTIFRFKHFNDGLKVFNSMNDNDRIEGQFRVLASQLFGISNSNKRQTIYQQLRNNIIQGLPNGYPYPWGEKELFDMLAKQPINKA